MLGYTLTVSNRVRPVVRAERCLQW